MTALQGQTETPESRARSDGPPSTTPGRRPRSDTGVLPAESLVDGPLYPLWVSGSLPEVLEMMAWSRERHDVEMRMRTLAVELDRAMNGLQALLGRYNELQERRAGTEPHLHRIEALPAGLETAITLARERLRERWLD